MACEGDPTCSVSLATYYECIATAKADSVKRAACVATFRNANDGKASDIVNCENLYRNVCNDV